MKILKSFNLLSIAATIAILIIALSIAYFLVIFLPTREKAKQEHVDKELQMKQAEFNKKTTTENRKELARKECIEELRLRFKDKPNYTLETANATYRRCLAEKGFEPEDLVKP